jgi:hypothetical protein
MVFLSLVLKPRFNRWANIVLGAVYGATILLSTIGEERADSVGLTSGGQSVPDELCAAPV